MSAARGMTHIGALVGLIAGVAGCGVVGYPAAVPPAHTQVFRSETASPLPAGGDALTSPIQGTVLRVAVETGAAVEEGALDDHVAQAGHDQHEHHRRGEHEGNGNDRATGRAQPSVGTDAGIVEQDDSTTLVSRPTRAVGDGREEAAQLTDPQDRGAERRFAVSLEPMTVRFFYVKSGKLKTPRDVDLRLTSDKAPSDRAWYLSVRDSLSG